jgi:hypothetical protein
MRDEQKTPEQVLEEMRSAGRALFGTRDREAIYAFLDRAYRQYRAVRKAGNRTSYKAALAKLAGIAVHHDTRLASVLVRISAPRKVSPSRASLLGGVLLGAYRRKIKPKDLRNEIEGAGGVSRAFGLWKKKRLAKPS